MKKVVSLFIVLLVFSAFNITAEQQELAIELPDFTAPDFSAVTPAEVLSITDGDTIVVEEGNDVRVKVRLIGIDTPETVHPSKPVETYGKEASLFLANLLKGEKVYLLNDESCQSVDKYGRRLCYVYRAPDGLFVNAEIVRQGYGHAYVQFPFKYLEQFRQLERFARTNQKGLWEELPIQEKKAVKQADTPTVYVTKTGKFYHREECRCLSLSKIPIQRSAAVEKGLKPCSVCNP